MASFGFAAWVRGVVVIFFGGFTGLRCLPTVLRIEVLVWLGNKKGLIKFILGLLSFNKAMSSKTFADSFKILSASVPPSGGEKKPSLWKMNTDSFALQMMRYNLESNCGSKADSGVSVHNIRIGLASKSKLEVGSTSRNFNASMSTNSFMKHCISLRWERCQTTIPISLHEILALLTRNLTRRVTCLASSTLETLPFLIVMWFSVFTVYID